MLAASAFGRGPVDKVTGELSFLALNKMGSRGVIFNAFFAAVGQI
jgi:hypothetical protein